MTARRPGVADTRARRPSARGLGPTEPPSDMPDCARAKPGSAEATPDHAHPTGRYPPAEPAAFSSSTVHRPPPTAPEPDSLVVIYIPPCPVCGHRRFVTSTQGTIRHLKCRKDHGGCGLTSKISA